MSGTPYGRERHIVLTGTFDVRNYGDLLFPLVAAHNLAPWGGVVHAVSPAGRATGWDDAAPVRPLLDVLQGDVPIDGVLIGGGNIIHPDPVSLPDYVDAGVADWAYSGLWIGASVAAAVRGVPLAWNAPGVPRPLSGETASLKNATLAAADYISVRDRMSAEYLLAPQGVTPEIVPDTALQLAEIWPRQALAARFRAVLARSGVDPEAACLAVHVKKRSLHRAENVAVSLEAFCKAQGLIPILIGIGACHGDDAIAASMAAAVSIPVVDLSRPAGLREIAACISHSRAYVGASMHGYVTAAAYGIPGVIVGRPRLPKIAGLLQHLDRTADEAADWDEGFGKVRLRLGTGATAIPERVHQALAAHWNRIRTTLERQAGATPRQRALSGESGSSRVWTELFDRG